MREGRKNQASVYMEVQILVVRCRRIVLVCLPYHVFTLYIR